MNLLSVMISSYWNVQKKVVKRSKWKCRYLFCFVAEIRYMIWIEVTENKFSKDLCFFYAKTSEIRKNIKGRCNFLISIIDVAISA